MAKTTTDDMVAKRLSQLLGDVRNTLKSGEYGNLNGLAAQQETLLAKLLAKPDGQPDLSRAGFEDLIAGAKRNENLLAAALNGIKSARRRHEDVVNLGEATQTYDRTGRRSKLTPITADLEKRS
ncbi:MAG: hypothetical protein GXP05_02635 [Alphaproteobacteria bacterium]|nr:hypothetical protein [Alphaproteobacteria bacterium]